MSAARRRNLIRRLLAPVYFRQVAMTQALPFVRRAWDRALTVDEERKEIEGPFGPLQITALSRDSERIVRMRWAQLGPVGIADVIHEADVRTYADRRPGYQLMVPVHGRVDSRYLGTTSVYTRGKAQLGRLEGPVTSWMAAGSRVVGVSFSVVHVHRALEYQLGQQVTSQIPFAPVIDGTTQRGAGWISMLLTLNELLRHDDTLLLNPIVALPVIESLTHGLLLAADHPYRRILDQEAGYVRPSSVRIATELMETEPSRPLTLRDLAAEAHVSIRTLNDGFQREFGMPPMAYLRDVRLRRAHADLLAADPSLTTVALIARRWGFPHLGRFSARYSAAFGELPKATLRRSR